MTLQKIQSALLAVVSTLLATCGPATAEPQTDRPKIGLALGGGGTRGLAHIGVLRAFEKQGIPIDYIAGTSMGAIVGGLYSAGMTLDEIEKLFRNKSLQKSFDTIPIPLRVSLIPIFFVPHIFGYHPYDGLYRGNKFANFLTDRVPVANRNIECGRIPFCAVASNLLDGKAYAISTGNIGRALQASSAIPALRRPVPWQGKLFVDGGVINNIPVTQCKEMGADIVIAVDVDETLDILKPEHFRKIGSVGDRCVNMHLEKLDEPQVSKADLIIHPDVNGIGLLSRKQTDVTRAIQAGEEATQKAAPEIQQRVNGKICNSESEEKS